ncbi:MAG: STAS domain-containing protein [candidate division KSB1 bacterium]|nr:STAS domain-containing protein [candidate division KSB1 bacterium]
MTNLRIRQVQRDRVTILALEGTLLGGQEGEELRNLVYEAVQQERNRVVLDLGGVTWMNSSGLGLLVAALSTLRASGGEMVLARVPDRVLRTLQITRLESVFRMVPGVDEGVAELAEGV